jgi:hypothetical protein
MKRQLKWLAVVSALGCGAIVGPGCGGDDATVTTPEDSGADGGAKDGSVVPGPDTSTGGGDTSTGSDTSTGGDTTVSDTSTTDTSTSDTSTSDTSSDSPSESASDASDSGADVLPTTCTTVGAACDNGGTNGICDGTLNCGPCTTVTGDSGTGGDLQCSTAYGGSQLCIGGSCTAGDCRSNIDCTGNANGSYCGIAAPNFCGKCTSDTQCGNNEICEILTDGGAGSGVCVSSSGICAGGSDNIACPLNPNDVCCGSVCDPGNCCNNAGNTCAVRFGAGSSCDTTIHTCTTCASPSAADIYVDPVNGSDTSGTGAQTLSDGGASSNCAFKTITRALQVVGSPGGAVTIHVIGPATVAAGETFPIKIPQNVTVTTQGGAVTVNVPAQASAGAPTVGFELAHASSGIIGGTGAALTISGQSKTANVGVLVLSGSTDGTSLQDLTISNFKNDGIDIAGGATLSIRQGVSSTGNLDGLNVFGTTASHAIINIPNGQRTTSFNQNVNHGILVQQQGYVLITGTPSGNSTGTVETNANTNGAGVRITQSGTTPTQAQITGLVSYGNGLHGMHVLGGSNLQLRNSIILANLRNGVMVSTGPSNNGDVSNIDLGTSSSSYGFNTLQASLGNNPNTLSGICLTLPAGSGTLAAEGNIFSTLNCNADGGTLTSTQDLCGGGKDIGIVAVLRLADGGMLDAAAYDAGSSSFGGNNIDTNLCTH